MLIIRIRGFNIFKNEKIKIKILLFYLKGNIRGKHVLTYNT